MIINWRFYCGIASSEIQYGLRPSEKLNFTRLLSGLPAWEKPAGAALKKKTLIVNASDLCTINPIEYQIIIKERLEVLAQQGFDLHLFYHNNLHPWTAIKRAELTDDGMHIQTGDAVQILGLSADELLILDGNILVELIKGDDEDWVPYRHLTKITLHQSNLSSDSLTKLLEARQEEITALTISECLNLEGFKPPLGLRLPNLRELHFKYSAHSSSRLLSSHSKALPNALISTLIKMAPVLRRLNLDDCHQVSRDILSHLTSAPEIETLALRNCPVNPETLTKVLTGMRQIIILDLRGHKKLNDIIPAQLNTEKLEILCLDDPELNDIKLRLLLQHRQKLSVLRLESCQKITDWLFLAHDLDSLEMLVLKQANISTQALEQLIKSAPSLKALNLSQCTNLEGNILEALNLSSLESLYLIESNINIQALEQLIKSAPNLKALNLVGCTDLAGNILETLNLSSLETIVLRQANISIQALEQLIKSAPNLKALNLYRCTNLEGNILEALNLSSLETLDLIEFNISIQALEQLIKSAPNLKTLKLIRCTNLDKERIARIIAQYPALTVFGLEAPETRAAAIETAARVKMDANTQPDLQKTLSAQTVFYSRDRNIKAPPVSSYRLKTYNALRVAQQPCTIEDAFTLENEGSFEPVETSLQQSMSDTWHLEFQSNCFYGKHLLSISTQWQPLASISAAETILQYHLSDDVPHELKYSMRDNLYYIRLHTLPANTKALTIDFITQQPKPLSSESRLPREIQSKITACDAFEAKALEGPSAPATGADYMAALEAQAVGACRHRAVVFMHWMKKEYPDMRVRTVMNDVHAFIELHHDNQWWRIDLGGYETNLDLSDPCPPPDSAPKASAQPVALNSDGSIRPSHFPMPQPEPQARSSREYIQNLLSSENKRMLVDIAESNIAALRRAIEQAQGNQPCWYIHSPEDLITSAPFIARILQADGRYTGELHKGPGGPFYDFLKRAEHEAPLIIVNYAQFTAADIVRFNALLDPIREADGTKLPEKAIVLGLSDLSKPGAYDGADFLSRFDRAPIKCPLSSAQLPSPIEIQQQAEVAADCVIDLLGGSRWEEQLLGSWSLSGQELTFVPGALIEALTSNPAKTHIELRNAPWDNKDFARFWQDTLSSRKLCSRYDSLPLPEGFFITKRQYYDWALLTQSITPASAPELTQAHHMLNPSTLSLFLGAYACDNETHTVTRSEGLLKASAGQTLQVYLSTPLSDSDWAKLLTECTTHHVILNLHKAPGLALPKAWDAHKVIPESRAPLNACAQNQDCIIQSTDKDLLRRQLNASNLIEIDVSELESEHLLTQIQASFDKEQLRFSFTQSEGALLCALAENKTVVLHGTIKPSLWDALNQLMMKRQQQDLSTRQGVLIILGTPPLPQPHLPLFKHQVSLAEKVSALGIEGLESETLEDKPYTQLRAEAAHKARESSPPNSTPWQGIHSLPPEQQPLGPLDLSVDAANAMNTQRITAVSETLANAPFVLLSGKTGVGKSSFIPEWRKAHPAVHMGESALLDWARDISPGIKTLFIDEANISGSDWTLFEGLFNTNPGIVIDSVYYPLSKEHKVIFAANPMSYGGERRLPALFERHGNSVIFEPMTPAFLYHKVLAPLLNNQDDLAKPLLDIAQFFASCSPNAVLISPRELEMMALLAMSYCRRTPSANPLEAVEYYAYSLGKALAPRERSTEFDQRFKRGELARVQLAVVGLCLTQSNHPAHQALNDLLELRKARQVGSMPSTGGLGGLIIEGEPGVGKSELVIKTLLAQGLTKANNQQEHPDGCVFYILPPSYSYKDKEALLLKAFHEGAVVVIDEINSSHMMERLLNALLMGKTLTGESAVKPGFMIVGTQNPISMAGRTKASNALQRRTQKVIIPEYSQDEMSSILQSKGLDAARAQELIDDYLQAKKTQNLCLRDLVKRAEVLVKATQHTGLRFFKHRERPLERRRIMSNPSESDTDSGAIKRRQPEQDAEEEDDSDDSLPNPSSPKRQRTAAPLSSSLKRRQPEQGDEEEDDDSLPNPSSAKRQRTANSFNRGQPEQGTEDNDDDDSDEVLQSP